MKRLFGRRSSVLSPPGQAAYPPLIDMLTILLFYLLQTYSHDPPVRPSDPHFQLSKSTSTEIVHPAIDLDVTEEGIYLEGERAASSKYYLQHDDTLVMELYERLQGRAARRVNVRADARVPYLLLNKILVTANEAGVEQLSIVALNRSGL